MVRVIAFYLPQFHPIPENDEWWGPGFTEWTNVAKAKPLFRGHYQPRIPADLGFYDLRLPQTREKQAVLAKEAGIEGFIYWHYWFGNKRKILERPFFEVLNSGEPDFPFCLAWANHDWTNKTWYKHTRWSEEKILLEQTYPGADDYVDHFYELLKAFEDKRYIRVDGKPMFLIHDPLGFPDVSSFMLLWRELALKNGLNGIHFVGLSEASTSFKMQKNGKWKRSIPSTDNVAFVYQRILDLGFDAVNSSGKRRAEMLSKGKYSDLISFAFKHFGLNLFVKKYNYKKVMRYFYTEEDKSENIYPTLFPQWDRTARIGKLTDVYVNCNPDNFKETVIDALTYVKHKNSEQQILFLRSWNEWAEGNYIEPDLKYGKGYIEALSSALNNCE